MNPLIVDKHTFLFDNSINYKINSQEISATKKAVECAVKSGLQGTDYKQFVGVCTVGKFVFTDCKEEGLVFGTVFLSWLWLFDDQFDYSIYPPEIEAEILQRVEHIFQYGVLPPTNCENPTRAALEKLGLEVRKMAEKLTNRRKSAFSRFLTAMMDFFRELVPVSVLQRIAYNTHELPTLEAYTKLRLINSGIHCMIGAQEIADEVDIPDSLIDLPQIQRMGDLACLIISFSNDIYSYNKEVKEMICPLNSLYIREQKLQSFEKALAEQINETNDWIKEFTQLKSELKALGLLSKELNLYCESMEKAMIGIKEWSYEWERYKIVS